MQVLKIQNLQKSFGGKQVLKGVDLNVPEGSIFGFIGANGAGKTTTMKCILGILQSDGGSIEIMGEPVRFGETPTNRFVGYLPDVPEFYSYMTAREYLVFCGKLTNVKDAEKRADELLQLVGLYGEKSKVKGFSRGMKQRLGIAQALFNKPKLLICDEPTSALDPVGRKEILDVLSAVKGETTVLFSTHILSDVEKICSDVAFLDNGVIRYQGKIEDLKKRNASRGFAIKFSTKEDADEAERVLDGKRVDETSLEFLGEKNMQEILRLILQNDWEIEKAERKERDLESLFLETTKK